MSRKLVAFISENRCADVADHRAPPPLKQQFPSHQIVVDTAEQRRQHRKKAQNITNLLNVDKKMFCQGSME
jgi:hypothetical protein